MSEVLPVDDFPGNPRWEPLKPLVHLLDQLHQETKGFVFLGSGSSFVRILKQHCHRGFQPQMEGLTEYSQLLIFLVHVVNVLDFVSMR